MKGKIASVDNQHDVEQYRRLPNWTRTNIVPDYDVNITYTNNKQAGKSYVRYD